MPIRARSALVALLGLCCVAPPLRAQQPDTLPSADPATMRASDSARDSVFTVRKYLDYETVADPRISPDGSRIVYTRRRVDTIEDRWRSALWIMDADGKRNRYLVDGSNAVWSPDGRRIAYLAEQEEEPKEPQIFVLWVDAGTPATQVTREAETPGNLRWSPDGGQIGFTRFVPKPPTWKIDLPAPPEGAKWTESPTYVDQLHYRQDRRGLTEAGHTHLFTVPAEGGTPRQLTTGDWSVGFRFDRLAGDVGWDWTPDGRTIVVEGLNVPDSVADLSYRDASLYAIDVASGALRNLTPERGTWTGPVVSADGRWVAFTGTPYGRYSYRVADLYLMPLAGGPIRRLSEGLDRDAEELRWAPDGSGIFFTAEDRGARNLFFASKDGRVRPVTEGAQMLTLGSLARTGVAVGVRSSSQNPPDIVRIDLRRGGMRGDLDRLTDVNVDLLDGIRLGAVEEVWYTSSGGARVQGWVVKPPAFDSTRTYPLILEIHGGPHAMYNVGFNPMLQNFAANGYVVLYTNPRGSTGYGSAFGNAIERAYPSVDYDDLMAGVDAVLARGYIDRSRMFVGGCSGGGVLSSWTIGHTDRFAAAAVRCPVTNWLSFAGHTDVPLFTANFFDRPFWEDPAPWLRQSPLMYVGRVTTPTLLMTGELDLRTPMPQTEEYFAALRMRGVPSALLRFQGEYHGTGSKPSNWMRTQLYMMSWYERWGGKTPAQRMAGRAGQH